MVRQRALRENCESVQSPQTRGNNLNHDDAESGFWLYEHSERETIFPNGWHGSGNGRELVAFGIVDVEAANTDA